jgi:hypothetical protein
MLKTPFMSTDDEQLRSHQEMTISSVAGCCLCLYTLLRDTTRNCVISLFRLHNIRYTPDGFDYFADRPCEALAAIGC